jgi:hypothetical protein
MPELKALPNVEHVNLETLPFSKLDEMADVTALALVNGTLNQYENGDRSIQRLRWQEADELYAGYKPKETWPGSQVAMSNHPVRVVFDMIESAIPAIREAVFGMEDFFDITALPGGNPQQAEQLKARLRYVLGQQKSGYAATFESEFMAAEHSALLYGQGVLGIEFNPASKLPEVVNVDIRNFYADPNNKSPWVDNSRSVIWCQKKSLDDIEKWRGAPGVKLPSKELLYTLSKSGYFSQDDTATRESATVAQGAGNDLVNDTTIHPSHGLIDTAIYYCKDRIIVVLGRRMVIFNQENPYGCLPFAVIPCYPYPNRFAAQSYADILLSEQRVTEGLLNGRLNELSLILNPPRAMGDSYNNMTPAQESYRPGAVYRIKDPKESMVVLKTQEVSTNIWNEVDFWRRSAETRTGINGIAQGSARPGNVNRTAGGVGAQMQASALRLSTLVWNAEIFGVVPLITKIVKFLQVHEQPGNFAPGLGENGYEMVPTSSYYAPVTISVRAASKMMSREKKQQVLPFLMQNLANGQMVQGLTAAKMTVDWPRVFTFVSEALGIDGTLPFVRPMSPEEIQALNTPPPQVVAQQQKSQLDTQRALQITQMNNQTDLQKAMIAKQPDPAEQQREAQKLQFEQAKAQMELQMKQMELEYKKQEAALKLQVKNVEMQQKAAQARMDQALGLQKAETDIRIGQTRAGLEEQRAQREQERGEAEHSFAMKSMNDKSSLQNKLNRDRMEMSRAKLRSTTEKPQGAKASRPKDE